MASSESLSHPPLYYFLHCPLYWRNDFVYYLFIYLFMNHQGVSLKFKFGFSRSGLGWGSAFPAGSQVLPMLLVQGPHFEDCCVSVCSALSDGVCGPLLKWNKSDRYSMSAVRTQLGPVCLRSRVRTSGRNGRSADLQIGRGSKNGVRPQRNWSYLWKYALSFER